MTPSVTTALVLATVMIALTGYGCYHLGRRHERQDASLFTLLGAHLIDQLTSVPVGGALTVRFEHTSDDTFNATLHPDSAASDA